MSELTMIRRRLRRISGRRLWLAPLVWLALCGLGSAVAAQGLSIDDVSVVEGDGATVAAVFTVSLSAVTPLQVTVDYSTVDGSATVVGEDYLPTAGTLVFIGNTPQTITVPVLGDLDVEPDEQFQVVLSNAQNATIQDGSGTATVLNDDSPVALTLSIDDAEVVEGDAGNQAAVFTVRLSAPSPDTVTVAFATADGSATVADGDYLAISGVVSLPPNQTSQTIRVSVVGDTRVEQDEAFTVNLSAADGATLADARGVGLIRDDDTPPVEATLSIDDVDIFEGDGGSVEARFTVSLSEPIDNQVTFTYATRDGTASANSGDYQADQGQLAIAAGNLQQTISVAVTGDTMVEPDETFFVDLSQVSGAALGDAEGRATIRNDDQPGLSIDDVEILEGDSGTVAAVFMVALSQPTDSPVRVDYTTRDGTASAATGDYRQSSGTLEIAAGSSAAQLTILVEGDQLVEGEETFFVDLSSPSGANIGDGEGRGTILNDDQPTLSIGDQRLSEGDSDATTARFTVRLDQAPLAPVSVAFATADGSATVADNDYRQASGELSFAAGQRSAEISVLVVGDTRDEADETFFVRLSNPDGATLADPEGQGTIVDDDEPAAPGLPTVSIADTTVVEGDSGVVEALLAVRLSSPASGPVTVDFATRDGVGEGAATVADNDYRSNAGTLTFLPGESELQIVVQVIGDRQVETDERLSVELLSASGAALADASATVTIGNDDERAILEAVSDTSFNSRVDSEIALQVRVVRADGSAVAGAPVLWRLTSGDATLAGSDGPEVTTSSGADGVAEQILQLGSTGGEVEIEAEIPTTNQRLTFLVTVAGNLADLDGLLAGSGEASVGAVLDRSCRGASGQFGQLCDYVFGLDRADDQRTVLSEITPEETAAQADAALRAPLAQQRHIRARLAELRSGNAAPVTSSRFAVNLRGQTLVVNSLLAEAMADDPRPDWASELTGASLVRLSESGSADAAAAQAPGMAADLDIDQPSRLGFFVNGSVSFGDRPGNDREAGLELDSQELTAGLDYRLTERWVLGGALGYLDSSSDYLADGGSLEVQGLGVSGYLSYFVKNFYFEAVAGYGRDDYDTERNIDLPVAFQGQRRLVARATPEGSQLSFSVGGGFEAAFGAWALGGFGRLSWAEVEVDPYAETGAGPFSLAISRQNVDSLLSEAGVELIYAKGFGWGVLQPILRFSWLHQFEDDSRLIRGRFVADPNAAVFAVPTAAPDRDYLNLGAGFAATLKHGRSLYLLWDTDVERQDLDLDTVSFGFRLEL